MTNYGEGRKYVDVELTGRSPNYLNLTRGGQGDLPLLVATDDDLVNIKKELEKSSRIKGERLKQIINIC